MKHANIPVFIPQLGCPKQCVFCDQRAISGVRSFVLSSVRDTIERALATVGDRETEIAYFGGSFTGIPREEMTALLDLAAEYVRAGRVSGIRFSTRPDYIDEEIVALLLRYPVAAAELGIQSLSDRVLLATKRGHTADDSRRALCLLREAGIPTVGQMMVGLPSSMEEDEVKTAFELCSLGISACRIYPTVVFRRTELYEMWMRSEYRALTMEEAVSRSASVFAVFAERGVDCLRIGLCDNEGLHGDEAAAGPVHPALGELVRSELYFRKMCKALDAARPSAGETVTFWAAPGEISAVTGQGRRNKIRIENKYNVKKVKLIEKDTVPRYNVLLSCEREKGKEAGTCI